MIQNVRSGQPLTAGLLNNIIAQANGQDIPSNQNFVNTDKGTLFVNNTDYDVEGSEGTFNKFLECWVGVAPKLQERPDTYVVDDGGNLSSTSHIFINLGNSSSEACKNITVNNKPISGIILISDNQSLDCVVSDEILSKNNYVQLAEVGSDDSAYNVHFVLVKVLKTNYGSGQSPEVLGYVVLISKEDAQTAKSRAEQKIKEIFSSADEFQIICEKQILATENGTKKDINQNVIGSQDFTDCILSCDSDVSDEGQTVKQYSTEISSTLIETYDTSGNIILQAVPYLGLYKFYETKQDLDFVLNAEHPAISSDYQILVKDKSSDVHYLKYATLSIDLSGVCLVDTEIPEVNLSSIDKKTTDDNSRTYLTLHNFDKIEKDLTLSISHETPNLPDNIQILVRDNDGGTKTLKYADLSIDFQNISTDTQVTQNKSIDVVHSEELSGDYLQLYNFDKDSSGTYKFLPNKQGYERSSGSTKCDFVCKSVDGATKEVAYMETSVEYPEGDNSSIVYNRSNDLAYYYELYSFARHSTTPIEIYVNNVYGPLTATSIATGYEFLAKGPGGNLEYIDLQLGVGDRFYADSQFGDTSKTIEEKYNNGVPYFCLYGIDNTPVQKTVKLVENGTVDTGLKFVTLTDNKETEIAELKITLPDLSTGTITNNITEICSSISVISGDLENNTQSIEELYGQVDELSTKVDELSGKLSGEYWNLGGNSSNCYGSAIGDSNQIEAINLDNNQLVGQWQATQLEVTQSLNASTVIANDVIASGGMMAGTTIQAAEINCGNQLRIGSTTITEEQLQRLLALLQ